MTRDICKQCPAEIYNLQLKEKFKKLTVDNADLRFGLSEANKRAEIVEKDRDKYYNQCVDLRAQLEAIKAENSKLSLEAATAKNWQKKYVSTKLALEMEEKRADAAERERDRRHAEFMDAKECIDSIDTSMSVQARKTIDAWRGNHGTEGER